MYIYICNIYICTFVSQLIWSQIVVSALGRPCRVHSANPFVSVGGRALQPNPATERMPILSRDQGET